MTVQSSDAVRQPLRARQRSRRTLDQRLLVRFPRLARATLARVLQQSPRSRLRRASLRRSAELSLEAFNRRDVDAVMIGAAPQFEYRPEQTWVDAGLVEPRYVGLAGYRTYVATVDEVWGGQNHLTPIELIDLGDRIAMFADADMRAQASGVPLSQEYAAVLTVKDGNVVHLQEYFDHRRALEALSLGGARESGYAGLIE